MANTVTAIKHGAAAEGRDVLRRFDKPRRSDRNVRVTRNPEKG